MLTGLLLAILAIVGAAVVVGGGMTALARRGRAELESPSRRLLGTGGDSPGEERSIGQLRTGDIVQRIERDFLVEAVIEYDEDGHRWRASRLSDGRDEAWLVVGMERRGSSLRWLAIDDSYEVSGYPPDPIVLEEVSYALAGRGTATARLTGEPGPFFAALPHASTSTHRCRFWRYESGGKRCLVLEQWGEAWRVLRGQVLGPAELQMMPGS